MLPPGSAAWACKGAEHEAKSQGKNRRRRAHDPGHAVPHGVPVLGGRGPRMGGGGDVCPVHPAPRPQRRMVQKLVPGKVQPGSDFSACHRFAGVSGHAGAALERVFGDGPKSAGFSEALPAADYCAERPGRGGGALWNLRLFPPGFAHIPVFANAFCILRFYAPWDNTNTI